MSKSARRTRLNETRHQVSKESKAATKSPLPWPIDMAAVARLRPSDRNARTHSKKQVAQIADSIRRFGVINPVIADATNQIVAGHARWEAARQLGIKEVPVIRVSHLSDLEVRAYMLADNKLAEKAGWDRGRLAIELAELQVELPEIKLDLGITGFEPQEIDAILLDLGGEHLEKLVPSKIKFFNFERLRWASARFAKSLWAMTPVAPIEKLDFRLKSSWPTQWTSHSICLGTECIGLSAWSRSI